MASHPHLGRRPGGASTTRSAQPSTINMMIHETCGSGVRKSQKVEVWLSNCTMSATIPPTARTFPCKNPSRKEWGMEVLRKAKHSADVMTNRAPATIPPAVTNNGLTR